MEDAARNFQRFQETKQEGLRLTLALDGFFQSEGIGGARSEQDEEFSRRKDAYAAYLKVRIRPAFEWLIRHEEVEKMEVLANQGWFGQRELEGFLRTALEENKPVSLMWLVRWKAKNYGFEDRDFSL